MRSLHLIVWSTIALAGCDSIELDKQQAAARDTAAPAPADTADPEPEDSGDDGGSGGSGDDGGSGDHGGSGDDGGSGSGDDGGSGSGGDTGAVEPDCPDDVVCVDSFPFEATASTSSGPFDAFDSYGCAPGTSESGPEVVYQVTLDEAGFLAVDLPWVAEDADVDVHILGSLDPDDCLDRGHWRAGAFLEAGTYYVVADTWVSSGGTEYDGEYTLTLGHTTASVLGADPTFVEDALYAFDVAWQAGDTDSFVYALTDWTLHSSLERQWVVDLAQNDVLFNLLTTHGENSASTRDYGLAVSFSNTPESHQSSLGMMRAGETYTGSYGYSMRLDGLEPGYNDNVRSRAIVLHPWEWARQEVVDEYGMLGLSWGCPAVDDRISRDVIDATDDGSLFFFWYPDGDWSRNSDYLP